MHRKFREEVLTGRQFQQALSGFDEIAEEFICTYGREQALRSLDALHLATFSLVADQDADWRFVVADNRLYDVVREEGCPVIHPVREK